ncbi:MAG: dephospho-CoA kinase [Oceanospirillaceae bacterium]|nr:dephospho-CoA kinase [Oceanospirillaceae bacterium]
MSHHNILGITGGIGCGKSTVTDLFAKLGVKVVDADSVAREVVTLGSPGLNAIVAEFGREILLQNSELNRAALREIIFNDPEKKHWLESLLHPLIRQRILELLNSNNEHSAYSILSSPLLLETDQQQLTDLVLVIDLNYQTQLNRAMHRDNNSRQQIEKIMANQLNGEQRNAKADIILNNDGTLSDLAEKINSIHQRLTKKFPSTRKQHVD